ncbi:type I-E CRISPR-associated protein Cse1/CasA [Kitasatospora sp. NPDC101235]|uniref:type I-E CRISPR-associated protein Cse1/CasA n=1 Tax=Kitasatospora sp. NPDC101235 TaxID=3364101 RepID=UPI00380B98AC
MDPDDLCSGPFFRLRLSRTADPTELVRLFPRAGPGEVVTAGLSATLKGAHLVEDLVVANPACETMLRRLLTAMTVRIAGLDAAADPGEWYRHLAALIRRGRLPARAVDAYIRPLRGRLRLSVLLQDPRLREECSKSAAPGKLAMDRPSGHNQPWRPHTPEHEPLEAANALLWVLAWQGFGPSGMGALRAYDGVVSKQMRAGALRGSISYHPLGDTLFAGLVLGCPPPHLWPDPPGDDRAPWEREDLPDPLHPVVPGGPATLLIGRSAHAVLLDLDPDRTKAVGCWVAWATRTPVPPAADPFLIHYQKGFRHADARRHLLRDFDALVHAAVPGATPAKGITMPAWLGTLAALPKETLDALGPVRVRALGCQQQSQERGEVQWVSETTPAGIAAFLPGHDPAREVCLGRLHTDTEEAADTLRYCLRGAWQQMAPGTADQAPWLDDALGQYWDTADRLFWPAAVNGGDLPDFAHTALGLYDTHTLPYAARPPGLAAIARHRRPLDRLARRSAPRGTPP